MGTSTWTTKEGEYNDPAMVLLASELAFLTTDCLVSYPLVLLHQIHTTGQCCGAAGPPSGAFGYFTYATRQGRL